MIDGVFSAFSMCHLTVTEYTFILNGGGLKMYVVDAARVQLTFLAPHPPRKTMFWTHAGGVQLTFFYPPSPYKNVSYIFWPPRVNRGLRGWGSKYVKIIQ